MHARKHTTHLHTRARPSICCIQEEISDQEKNWIRKYGHHDLWEVSFVAGREIQLGAHFILWREQKRRKKHLCCLSKAPIELQWLDLKYTYTCMTRSGPLCCSLGGASLNGLNGNPSVSVNYKDKIHNISLWMGTKRSIIAARYQSWQHTLYSVISMIICYRLFQG